MLKKLTLITFILSTFLANTVNAAEPKDMVLVKNGDFKMGDTFSTGAPGELPVHNVKVSSFYIGKYEVTQKEYGKIMGKNPSHFKGDSLPVEQVSWFDAIKFCNTKSQKESLPLSYKVSTGELLDAKGKVTKDITKVIGYRLPTEAEWEFAAKGGNKSLANKYSGSNNADDVSWFGDKKGKTHNVGTKKPNELGLYDMSGNVMEWCSDWFFYDYYKKSPLKNPYNSVATSDQVRVLRGGNWYLEAEDQRVSFRDCVDPGYAGDRNGLRIVRSAK